LFKTSRNIIIFIFATLSYLNNCHQDAPLINAIYKFIITGKATPWGKKFAKVTIIQVHIHHKKADSAKISKNVL